VEAALADGAPREQVRDLVNRVGRGLELLQRATRTQDGARDLRELEEVLRRWQELTAFLAEVERERGPEDELVKKRQERRAVRERLLSLIERSAVFQQKEAEQRQDLLVAAATNGLRVTAMLAALAGLLAFAAAMASRSQPTAVAGQSPAGELAPGRASLEATTMTKAINADQEVAVHIEIRPRR